ncbi:MAG: hypothetical protein GC190_21715 [Alphaproteobacteria bacterium]|nr:hypothetical protein [Alphaproteobacteria bacterium]
MWRDLASYCGKCFWLAWQGSITLASAWAPILGAALLAIIFGVADIDVTISSGFGGIAASTLMAIAAAWVLIFVSRLFFWAPFRLYRENLLALGNVIKERDELAAELTELEKPRPLSAPARNPDAIYQNDMLVGSVVAAQDIGSGRFQFVRVLGNSRFDFESPFQYRDVVLQVESLQQRTVGTQMGEQKQMLVGVVARIIGTA